MVKSREIVYSLNLIIYLSDIQILPLKMPQKLQEEEESP